MTNTPRAGWYDNPEPTTPPTMRYWDGTKWTNQLFTKFEGQPRTGIFGIKGRAEIELLRVRLKECETKINQSGLADGLETSEYLAKQEAEAEAKRSQAVQAAADAQQTATKLTQQIEQLKQTQAELSQDVLNLRLEGEMQQVGLFNFENPAESSAELAEELEKTRTKIKQLVRDKEATDASNNFTFNNSLAKGRKFVRSFSKIMLRAYNAEAENVVKAVNARNFDTLSKRLERARTSITEAGSMIDMRITPVYHAARMKELELAYKHRLAQAQEKELEKERRAELREQRKLEQEIKAAQEKLRKEKAHYEATLQALTANGDIEGAARIQAKLEDVDRAISDVDYRAANIRAGYVYVISNVGAFGANIVKIGLTRRLNPMDRIRELGDASVPFNFDVHALFFADDAVGVEAMLHREFAHCRVNQVNLRREYFETTPQEVLDVLKRHDVEVVEFKVDAEAEEFHTSRAIREKLANS